MPELERVAKIVGQRHQEIAKHSIVAPKVWRKLEKDRPGPSYTADTLEELKRRHPGTEFFLLIGSDSLSDLPGWYQPQRIVENAGLLVMLRAHHPAPSREELRAALALPETAPLRIEWVQAPPLIDIASRDLRRRVSEGRSIRYLVPRAVEIYIAEKHRYRESTAAPPHGPHG